MLGPVRRQKAHHYFDLLDRDDDNFIDGEDFQIQADDLADTRGLSDEAHEALRGQMQQWWHQLCAAADANDDEQVSRSEWEEFWDAICTAVEEGSEDRKKQMLESLERSAKVTFRTINASESGEITEEEYADWLDAWNATGSSEAFAELDRSGSGTLSEEDLIKATKEFYLSNDPSVPGHLLYGTLQ